MEDPTNHERAEWALVAVCAMAEVTHYRPDEQSVTMEDLRDPCFAGEFVGDLLCNIMHLCDATETSFTELLDSARMNHDEEVDEEREGDDDDQ